MLLVQKLGSLMCIFQAVGAAADSEPDSIHLSGFSAGILEGRSRLIISVLNVEMVAGNIRKF